MKLKKNNIESEIKVLKYYFIELCYNADCNKFFK